MFCTHAQSHAVQQCSGIRRVVQNCAQHLSGQLRRGLLVTAVLVDGSVKQALERRHLIFGIVWPRYLQPAPVGFNMLQKLAEGVAHKESHRQTGSIRRETQDVEVHAGLQHRIVELHPVAPAQLLDHAANVFLLIGIRVHALEEVLICRLTALRPKYDRSVTDTEYVIPVGEQIVQRGRVRKRGGLAGRSVEILLLTVRAECRGVE